MPSSPLQGPAAHETCRNCGTPLAGAFCHACGQKRFVDSDRRLGPLLFVANVAVYRACSSS